MKKNVSGQKIGCQMVSATDGSAFTGSVTVAVTLDAGTQATGTVGSGACTHEGNGYHTYAPSQAETNGDLAAFTFTGSGAVPATVQIYTSFPQTGDSYAIVNDGTNGNAAIKTAINTVDDFVDTEVAAIKAKTDNLPSDPADASDIAAAFATVNTKLDTIDDFLDTEIAAIKAKTDNLPAAPAATSDIPSAASVADAVWDEVQSGHTTAGTFGKYLDTAVSGVSTGGVSAADIADAVWDEALSGHTSAGTAGKALGDIDTHTDTETGAAAIRAAIGLASANLDTQLSTIDDFLDTEIAAIKAKTDNLPSDPADASGIAASFTTVNTKLDTIDDFLDTEIAAIKAKTDNLPASPAATSDIPSAASIADAVLDEALSGHTTAGSLGKAVSDIDTHTDTETGAAAIRAAVGLASANLDTQLAAKAEPGDAMALVADALDASAVAASGASEIAAAVATNAAATPLKVNVKSINDVPLTGTGVLGDEWGP